MNNQQDGWGKNINDLTDGLVLKIFNMKRFLVNSAVLLISLTSCLWSQPQMRQAPFRLLLVIMLVLRLHILIILEFCLLATRDGFWTLM